LVAGGELEDGEEADRDGPLAPGRRLQLPIEMSKRKQSTATHNFGIFLFS
jgi:hypothetical protein